MSYNTYNLIVMFNGTEENVIFNDLVAVDQNAAHADIQAAYGDCELVGFKQQ
jgi:hypothetical protein